VQLIIIALAISGVALILEVRAIFTILSPVRKARGLRAKLQCEG
jgi:hypothetical protein